MQKFKAKIVSMTPETKPKQIVLALEQPNVPDVTLELSKALPGKMEAGEELQFEGVAKSYTRQPFMVVFESSRIKIAGWTGKNAAGEVSGRKARARRKPRPSSKDGVAYGRQLWVYSAEYRARTFYKLDRAGGLL